MPNIDPHTFTDIDGDRLTISARPDGGAYFTPDEGATTELGDFAFDRTTTVRIFNHLEDILEGQTP